MAFSPQFLDELRARTGLADVIARRVRLIRKGREHSGLCPFHKEKTPSFTVNEEKGFYHCFGCGAHGGAIDFVMNTDNLSFPEAVERLAADAGMEIPVDSPEEQERSRKHQTLLQVMEAATVYFEKTLRMPEGRAALDYLHCRGIDDAAIKHFRLGFALDAKGALKGALAREGVSEEMMEAGGLLIRPDDAGRSPYDRFRGRVMFPITDGRGRVIAFGGRILDAGEPKYLNSPETALFHKGRVLYGLAQAQAPARKAGAVIVTEGYTDVIAMARAGFANVVAPLGTALTEEQIGELWKLAPEPVLCFDGDNAGQRAAARAAERALPLLKPGFSLRFAVLPPGEDPDSLINKNGPSAIAAAIAGAAPLSEVLWRMETGGRAAVTPEERASLQKRMEDHARRINDSLVRRHFLDAIRERLRPQRYAKGGAKRHDLAMAAPLGSLSAAAGHADPTVADQKTLIAGIINHPDLFHRIEDEIGRIGFNDRSFDLLRQALVSILSADHDITIKDLNEELRRQGFAETLDALFNDPVIRKHRYIKPEASDEDVRETWEQSLRRIRSDANALEIRNMKGADLDRQEWESFKTLKEASLEKDDE